MGRAIEEENSFLQVLLKLIPSEVIAVFIFIQGIMPRSLFPHLAIALLLVAICLAIPSRAVPPRRHWTSCAFPPSFEHVSVEQGLSQTTVHCILQDRRGFLWFGTEAGLNRYVIDLMEQGLVNHVAMNGAGPIHDYELARIGGTSESVARYIRTGEFGLWRETGELNEIIQEAATLGLGLGENLGRRLEASDFPHKDLSICAAGLALRAPSKLVAVSAGKTDAIAWPVMPADVVSNIAAPASLASTIFPSRSIRNSASGERRGSAGKVTVNMDPDPTRLWTMTRPPCISTTERTMARPRPLPLLRASLAREPR